MRRFLSIFIMLISIASNANSYDAIVSITPKMGEFETINQAILSINKRLNSNEIFTIFVKNGHYNEKINLKDPNIMLIGEDRDNTVIEYNLAAGMLDEQGNKIGTSGSAIFIVNASGIIIRNLTIRNSFDYRANQSLPKTNPARLTDPQAVAVLINNNSDRIRFDNVNLEGFQDTLYLKDNSRSYFTRVIISGHVDFIFGGGTAVIDDSELIARSRYVTDGAYGYLTAPSTNLNQSFGLVIINSRLTKEKHVPANTFALGRPWHPTTTFTDGRYADPNAVGFAVFINNEIDDHIYGWDKMSGKDINGQKKWFYPEDSRFYEFNNQGVGAKRADNKFLITQEQARKYRIESIFNDWPSKFLIKEIN
ncbi:pectinesterase family protein [Orbus wheelerorum]|uniref:pectinesterase family protein n=1 Tax=Orbus wheelerorum TaxID=3074111 RepID=UPI00370D324D